MSGHTAGPWVTAINGGRPIGVKDANGDWLTYKAGNDFAPVATLEANARLIAAAPELLAALYEVCSAVEYIDHDPDSRLGNAMKQVEAAIAKATGEGA